MQSRCVTRKTRVGLEGGEFLLHPNAMDIMAWFHTHHPNFDLLTNALKPELVKEAVSRYPPRRLFISLDGDQNTYQSMRGKDGYDGIISLLEQVIGKIPVSLMFTLSPYNDFSDLAHVAEVAKKFNIDLRTGVYNDISFFDTLEPSRFFEIGSLRNEEPRTLQEVKKMIEERKTSSEKKPIAGCTGNKIHRIREHIPSGIKDFPENYDFLVLYDEWRKGNVQLNCYSILDSLVILPDGNVPVCQNLDVTLGNVYNSSLDHILNSKESQKTQDHYCHNCNACWINFHRKYDVILYRTFEKYFGKFATGKLLGHYWWCHDHKMSYRKFMKS